MTITLKWRRTHLISSTSSVPNVTLEYSSFDSFFKFSGCNINILFVVFNTEEKVQLQYFIVSTKCDEISHLMTLDSCVDIMYVILIRKHYKVFFSFLFLDTVALRSFFFSRLLTENAKGKKNH
jgi:hypothetical protein